MGVTGDAVGDSVGVDDAEGTDDDTGVGMALGDTEPVGDRVGRSVTQSLR